ncbi:hypothetical protein ACFLTZ_03215 [Chloroflexota bacterium]
MRRAISIMLVVSGLFSAVTGIWNFLPPFSESFSPGHAIGACIFGTLCFIHVWLNWKPIVKYFKALGLWWIIVALGLIATVLVVIIPFIRM